MDLKEFNQLKEKLKDTEAKIYESFGVGNYMECSKCGQKISYFDILQFYDGKNIKNKVACPLCQAIPDIAKGSFCDPGDEIEILEYYLWSVRSRIRELYESKIESGINPYENDFIYSELIVIIFIALESLISKITSKRLQDKVTIDDSITKYIVEKMRPNINDYIELLEICGFEDIKNKLNRLRSIWDIRNNVIHRGYKADFVNFAQVYIGIGEILVYLQSES
ncbi:MAG: hypothetical protein COV71_05105 [Candidatus Omnitrophica bacterium CG11_big_fil_rev_8_21_14_0_20_41_12]|nr:MAG: hypothetical protein COV71_05105 [Candidatus Omnitrophica bacterium CG11_big_fil_rev_8_21_14_0_20_41_12]